MKKIIILSALILAGAAVYAEVNMPSAPSFNTPVRNTNQSSAYKKPGAVTQTKQPTANLQQIPQVNSKKAQMDSLAMNALRAAENHDQQGMNSYMQQMMQNGIEEFCQPQVISKRTPHCPPIKIKVNGRMLSGSKCAQMCYVLDGKQHDVGYCK